MPSCDGRIESSVYLDAHRAYSDLDELDDDEHAAGRRRSHHTPVRAPSRARTRQNGDHPDCTYTVELVPADGSGPARVVARVGRPFGGATDYELSPDGLRRGAALSRLC